MVPRLLAEWTLGVVERLAGAGFFEGDAHDFKEKLPPSKADDKKLRLRKTCAAFANGYGGFLVYGVADDRTLPVDGRLVGVDAGDDLLRDFGSYPRGCHPAVDWEPLSPAIVLPSGRLIHVIHIRKSWRAPHAVPAANGAWHFPKRTHAGNVDMTLPEIRAAFDAQADTARKLASLEMHLTHNASVWMQLRDRISAHPPEYPVFKCLTRAIEDYLVAPLFPDELPVQRVKLIWEYTHFIDDYMSRLLTAHITNDARQQLVSTITETIDTIVPICRQMAEMAAAMLKRVEDRSASAIGTPAAILGNSIMII